MMTDFLLALYLSHLLDPTRSSSSTIQMINFFLIFIVETRELQ